MRKGNNSSFVVRVGCEAKGTRAVFYSVLIHRYNGFNFSVMTQKIKKKVTGDRILVGVYLLLKICFVGVCVMGDVWGGSFGVFVRREVCGGGGA